MPAAADSNPSGRPPGPGSGAGYGQSALDETLYQFLGVPFTATRDEITRAYRRSMKRIHPDRVHPERRAAAEELAKELNRAYSTLSDPAKREAYDKTIRDVALQEEIMNRYVGGFAGPGMGSNGSQDPFATGLRRDITDYERRDQARADRSATLTLFGVFVGLTGVIILVVVFGSILGIFLRWIA